MATYEITAEMNLKKIIDKSREVAQVFNLFADDLEQIEKKYAETQESKDQNNDLCELCLRDPSKCRNLMSPCDYLPKYKVCPICKTNILPYDPICYRCGYDFRAEREDEVGRG